MPDHDIADEDLQRDDIVRYLAERRNWGRWGPDDQLGAINLITPEKRREAAALVTSGRSLSLSRPFPTSPGPTNPHPAMHHMNRIPRGDDGGAALDFIGVSCHGISSTHLDALCHVWADEGMWNGRDPDAEIGFQGATFGDLDAWRDGIVTRGVILDVPAFRNEPYVAYERPVHGAELEAIAEHQGSPIRPGDAVVVYCGREEWDRHNPPWGGTSGSGSAPTGAEQRAGLHASCLRFLRDHDVAVLVWDMMDLTPNGFELPWAVHAAIWAFGVALVDNALLEPLAAACAEERRHDFQLLLAPIRVVGGTGCPINPIVLM